MWPVLNSLLNLYWAGNFSRCAGWQGLLIAQRIIQGAGILAAWQSGRRLSIFNLCSTSDSEWGMGHVEMEGPWVWVWMPVWVWGSGWACNPFECPTSAAYKFGYIYIHAYTYVYALNTLLLLLLFKASGCLVLCCFSLHMNHTQRNPNSFKSLTIHGCPGDAATHPHG